MPEPVLAYLIGWPAFIGVLLAILGWKIWSTGRELRRFRSITKPDLRETPQAQEVSAPSSKSPQGLGAILGNHIIDKCRRELFTPEQNALLTITNRIVDLYHVEVICLTTFAVRTSISFQLDDHRKAAAIFEEVLIEVKRLLAAEKFAAILFDRLILSRLNAYDKVLIDEVRRSPETTSPIAFRFLNFIISPEENKAALEKGGRPYYDNAGQLVESSAFKKLQAKIGACAKLTDISMDYYFSTLQATREAFALENSALGFE